MPEKKTDPFFDAVSAVYAAIKDLQPDERRRVLLSVSALVEVPLPTGSASSNQAQANNPIEPIRTQSAARPTSVVELIQSKHPQTNAQRIALFAYFRERTENLTRFSRADIEAYFAKAKEPPPKNFARDFVDAVKKGWIHEDGSDSYLTSKGLEVVESGFEGVASASPRGRLRKAARARKAASKKAKKR